MRLNGVVLNKSHSLIPKNKCLFLILKCVRIHVDFAVRQSKFRDFLGEKEFLLLMMS